MVDFAGWSMPVQYTTIVQEHHATRTAIGLFDISHMGRIRFEGPGAETFLDRILTRRVRGLPPGRCRYGLVTNERGGMLDDVLVYCLTQPEGTASYLLVVNASNREKIVQWIEAHQEKERQVRWQDETMETAMIAVQGPLAVATVAPLVAGPLAELRYYRAMVTEVLGEPAVVSRTGYTGEDGCEMIVAAEMGQRVWEAVLQAGQEKGIQPAGLGARDTLRLEAALPLYGHELSESLTPFDAGLDFAVDLEDHEFIGCDALREAAAAPRSRRRVGLVLNGRRAAREHYPVFDGDRQVGEVTSGTFSPTLNYPIAMAYVASDVADEGRALAVDIRGRREEARVVELPFYVRSST